MIEPAIDRCCSLLAGEFGIHHHVGTGDAISTRKHSGQAGFECPWVGFERSPFGGFDTEPFSQATHIGKLADGDDGRITRQNKFGAVNRLGSGTATGIGLAKPHPQAFNAGHASIRPGLKRLGGGKKHQLDAFTLGVFDLARVGRHLGARAAIDDGDVGRSAAKSCARGVQRRVSSAKHQHTLSGDYRLFEIDPPQEFHSPADAGQRFSGNRELALNVSADGNKNSGKALPQLLERDAPAHRRIQKNFDPDGAQPVDFSIQQFARQAIRRNANRQHSTGSGERFENCRTIAFLPELISTDQSGRTRANDRNSLRAVGNRGLRKLVVGAIVCDEALQRRKINRIVHFGTRAHGGARMCTHAPAD